MRHVVNESSQSDDDKGAVLSCQVQAIFVSRDRVCGYECCIYAVTPNLFPGVFDSFCGVNDEILK
jgi:hypothetical protein